jgi:hypothetical protein
MLKIIFGWIDQHPWAYWLPAYAALALIVVLAVTVKREPGRERAWLWGVALFGFILAWRWPFLFTAEELNPDEAQWVAGALTLWMKDPVFGRAVDGTTSGPLNFYALWYARLIGLPIDFFSARLLVVGLSAGAVFAASQTLRLFMDARIARLAVLPAACFFAFNTEHQYIHYASEYVSLFLIAVGFHRLLKADLLRRDRLRAWTFAGFVLGLAPWAKFQALPMVGLLLIWGLWRAFGPDGGEGAEAGKMRRGWQRGGALVGGAGLPAMVVGLAVVAFDVWEPLYIGYVRYGSYYLETGGGFSPWQLLVAQWRQAAGVALLQTYVWSLVPAMLVSAIIWVIHGRRPGHGFWAALLLAVGALIAVVAPQRPFMHYTLYGVVPLTLVAGMVAGEAWTASVDGRGRRTGIAAALVFGVGLLLAAQIRLPEPFMLGSLQQHWREPRSALGRALRPLVKPGEPLAVWGWRARTYVENGNVQATRCAHSERMILDSPLRDYHRERYLRDFAESAPAVFVDATGPGAYEYEDRARFGHETFPALRDLIAREFMLHADLGDARIYVRRPGNSRR